MHGDTAIHYTHTHTQDTYGENQPCMEISTKSHLLCGFESTDRPMDVPTVAQGSVIGSFFLTTVTRKGIQSEQQHFSDLWNTMSKIQGSLQAQLQCDGHRSRDLGGRAGKRLRVVFSMFLSLRQDYGLNHILIFLPAMEF